MGTRYKDNRNGVAAWVPGRIGIDAEQRPQLDVEPSLLACFPNGRLLNGLAQIDETPGQRPAEWRVPATDQHDGPLPHLDDHVDRDPDLSGVGGHPAT